MPSKWVPCECGALRHPQATLCSRCHNAKRARKPCSIKGCDSLAYARGWCKKHYMAWQAHGDPLGMSEHHRKRLEAGLRLREKPPVAKRNDPKLNIKGRASYITGGQFVAPAVLAQDMEIAHSPDATTECKGADGMSREEVMLVRCPKCSSDSTWPCWVPRQDDASAWMRRNRDGTIHEERIKAAVQARAEHRI